LGDFNANQGRDKNFQLFKNLNSANATSLLSFHNITDPTWIGHSSTSQIDDIWCNSEIILDIEKLEIIDATYITDSDHRIITASWNIDISKQKTIRNKKKKRKIYHYEKMTKENWEDFTSEINDYAWNIMDSENWDQTTLNKTWNKWATVIKQIINSHIPFSFKTSKPFYAFSLKTTHLHLALKTINKCLRQLTNESSPPTTDAIDQYNKLLLKAANLAAMNVEPLTPTNLTSTLTQTITDLKQIKHTIWTARNLEKLQEQNKRINSYISRRYDDFKDNTSRMLDSILQRRSEPIKTDKIILPDRVITEKQEVKEHIRRHFKLWTKTNPPNINWQAEWEEIYHPIKKINPTIYEPVSEPITMEELRQTISLTPKNKATGPLPISNEILQHLPTSALDILLSIFNNSLRLNCVPDRWLQANVWPIPKKKTYNYDLNTTRPITLIDHTRKLFTKILSNRLTTTIMRYEVLSPMNFAAFPHQSTIQPVTQLTQMIEDANTNGKEIWALSQDMSKAFDSVNITTLEKALQRIKIPPSITKLIIYLLSHRTNRVITDLGFTEPYPVQDGIDQGETFSPLLWKIYYDPLISTIQRRYTGYACTIPTSTPKEINTSIMAYMDDSLWVAPNKEVLTDILTTATSFYKLNNIRVNPEKSFLITNSPHLPSHPSITFDDTGITALPHNTPLKYLGAWYTANGKHTHIQKLIIQEATTNLKKLTFARITEKQAIYITNHVIIPRLQYRLLSSYLNSTQIKDIKRTYLNIVKQKGKLAKGVPNSFLYCAKIYALCDLEQAQLSTLTSTLIKGLNHPHFDSSYLKLRIQQLQDSTMSNISILEEEPLFPTVQSRTHTAQAILAIHKLHLKLVRPLNNWPTTTNILGTSINNTLLKHPKGAYFKERLNEHNISCIEQFLNWKNNKLLDWKNFQHNIKKIIRGRTPKWFHQIHELITPTTTPSLELINPNPFTTPPWTPINKGWVITKNKLIAKVFNPHSTNYRGKHYVYSNSSNQLEPCLGCKFKDKKRQTKHCYITLDNHRIHNILVSCKRIIYADLTDIHRALSSDLPPLTSHDTKLIPTVSRPLSLFKDPPLTLWESLTSANFKKKEMTIQLTTKKELIAQTKKHTAICKISTKTDPLRCHNLYWPSKMNALTSLLAFIITTTDSTTKLKIITNNTPFAQTIEHITNLQCFEQQKIDKTPFPFTLRTLFSLLIDRKITITVDEDLTINNPPPAFPLDLTPHKFVYNRFTPLLINIPCIQPIKTVLKQIHQITNDLRWHNQQRISLWERYLTFINIHWDSTLDNLSYNDKPKGLYTNPSASNLKNFKIKLISEELPTCLLLHLRNQSKYPNHLCPRCYTTSEDITHLLTCIRNPFNFQTELKRILIKAATKLELPLHDTDEFIKSYTYLHIQKQLPIGFITNLTLAPFNTKILQTRHAPLIHHLITEFIYKEIWLPSRMYRHDDVFPHPPPIPTPTLTITKPPTLHYIQQKIELSITLGHSSLHKLLES